MDNADEAVRFDNELDALLAGEEPLSGRSSSSGLSTTAHHLVRLAAGPPPDPIFVARFRRSLLATKAPFQGYGGRVSTGPDSRLRQATLGARPRQWSPASSWNGLVATVGLLVVTFVGGGVAFLHGYGGSNRQIPAPSVAIVATPGDSGASCDVAPRQELPFPPISGNWASDVSDFAPDMPETWMLRQMAALFDRATPASLEARSAVATTLRQVVACRNALDPAREFALYTDRYLANAPVADTLGTPRVLTGNSLARRLGQAPRIPLEAVAPTVAGAWRLFSGDIGAVVRSGDSAFFVVFSRAGDRWLIDEFTVYPFAVGVDLPAASALTRGAFPPLGVAVVILTDDGVWPEEVTISAGILVTLAIANDGMSTRHFAVSDLAIDVSLRPGATATFEVDAAPGTYEFVSSGSGDDAGTGVGRLVVVAARAGS